MTLEIERKLNASLRKDMVDGLLASHNFLDSKHICKIVLLRNNLSFAI